VSRVIRDSGVDMVHHRSLAIAAVLALVAAAPLTAQIQEWQNQWYWGAKGGLIRYSLPTLGNVSRPQAGGEWLITAQRAALYASYSTSFKQDVDNYAIPQLNGATAQASFDAMQRIQLALLVFPWGGHIQPYAGGGFEIETLSNMTVNCSPLSSAECTTATNYMNQHSSGGFFLVMGGVQIRFGRLALFGQAQLSPQGKDFLLPNSSQSFEVGLRYAFLGAREEDLTSHR
jgi:hypothetical protein